MTVNEFVRWQAYAGMYPFGVDDLNFGRLLHMLASIYSPKERQPHLRDFLLGAMPDEPADTSVLEAKMNTLMAMEKQHEG